MTNNVIFAHGIFATAGGAGAAKTYGERSVTVDGGGSGDFEVLSDALVFVAGQNPSVLEPWLILIAPGIYQITDPVTVPPFTTVLGTSAGQVLNASAVKINVDGTSWRQSGGPLISIGGQSTIRGLQINYQDFTPFAADAQMIKYTGTGTNDDISLLNDLVIFCIGNFGGINFDLVSVTDRATYPGQMQTVFCLFIVNGVPGTRLTSLFVDDDAFSTAIFTNFAYGGEALRLGNNMNNGQMFATGCVFFPQQGAVIDINVLSGGMGITNSVYTTSSGNVIHTDRTVPNDSYATYQSGNALQVTSILQNITGQTADLQQYKDDQGNIMASIDTTGVADFTAYAVSGTAGFTGTFIANGQTVSVQGGIITGVF